MKFLKYYVFIAIVSMSFIGVVIYQATAAGGGTIGLLPRTTGGTPAGSTSEIQFNNNGVFGSFAGFTFSSSTGRLLINQQASDLTAAFTPVTITYTSPGNGDYVLNGALHNFGAWVYPYKLVGGVKYIASTNAENDQSTNSSQNVKITFSWPAVAGADGYRVFFLDDYYMNSDFSSNWKYYDVTTNSVSLGGSDSVENSTTAGNTLTPALPFFGPINVGIGSTTPTYPLTVVGTSSLSILKNGEVATEHTDGSLTFYPAAANTDFARGTALLTAVNAAVDLDTVFICNATYDVGSLESNYLELAKSSGTGSVDIKGCSAQNTIVKGYPQQATGALISIGASSTVSDLTAWNYGTSSIRLPIGRYLSTFNLTNFRIKNVIAISRSDGFYIVQNSAQIVSGIIDGFDCAANWDCNKIDAAGGTINIYNSRNVITASTSVSNSNTSLIVSGGVTVNMYNFDANTEATTTARSILCSQSGTPASTVNFYSGKVRTSTSRKGSGATVVDLFQSGTNCNINVGPAVQYNNASTSGTITRVPQWGGDITDVTGKIGIGTSSPYAALSVVGSGGVVSDSYFATSTTATSSLLGNLEIGNAVGNAYIRINGSGSMNIGVPNSINLITGLTKPSININCGPSAPSTLGDCINVGNKTDGWLELGIGVVGQELCLLSGNSDEFLACKANNSTGDYWYGNKLVTVKYNTGSGTDGRVGIGTTSPNWRFEVASSTNAAIALTDTNASANNKHWVETNNAGVLSLATTTDSFVSNANPFLNITNVGATTFRGASFKFFPDGNQKFGVDMLGGAMFRLGMNSPSSNTARLMQFTNFGDSVENFSWDIDSSGNPAFNLHQKQFLWGKATSGIFTQTAVLKHISVTGGNVDIDPLFGLATTSPWGELSVNPNVTNGSLPSFVIGSSTGTTFIVDNAGRVGIGTTSPFKTLSVQSTVATTTIVHGSSANPSCDLYYSPNGTSYRTYMSNAGALVTEAGTCQ